MQPYAIAILVALVGEWLLASLADTLNLRALRQGLPPEFRDVYDETRYRRAQAYTRASTRLGLLTATVNLTALLLFWQLDGFARLDRWTRLLGLGPVGTGLAFIGTLLLAQSALNLPARLYSTFGIESRFGFNRTTAATFWIDLVKGLGLAVVIGGPVLAVVLHFFEHAGPLAWLYCWVATTIVVLGVQVVVPTWILPLFYRFTRLEDGELHDAILAYARTADFPLAGIFVVDGSRRSTKANAFFTGMGRSKRIALFDTLLANHSIAEIVAVVAHEVGHYRLRHVPRRLAVDVLHAGVIFALLSFFLHDARLYAAFGMEEPAIYAGLVFFGLLYTPIEVMLSLVLHAGSRRDELAADRFAGTTTGQPGMLARALKRLASEQLANLTPHPLYVALHYSHPPIVQRLHALGFGA